MASRKRERVTEEDLAAIAAKVREENARSAAHHAVPLAHSDSGGPATVGDAPSVHFPTPIDFSRHFDPPLNPALASDPGGWCVHESAWQYGKPVIARDAAGGALCGLTEAEARFAVRVLGSGYTAARES